MGEPPDLKPIISLTSFRVIQEALNNIQKYAHAKNIAIKIEFLDKKITIVVVDDGVGFDIEKVTTRNKTMDCGFGLTSMQERISLLNGNFEIITAEKKGTKIIVSIPFD